MKVFLDDVRTPPEGWVHVRWPSDVFKLLETNEVTHLSLDHDLGDAENADHEGRIERTGYTVMLWLEEKVFFDRAYKVPEITFHSDNSVGVQKMRASLTKILDLKSR
jgi:hypothetical protein